MVRNFCRRLIFLALHKWWDGDLRKKKERKRNSVSSNIFPWKLLAIGYHWNIVMSVWWSVHGWWGSTIPLGTDSQITLYFTLKMASG
jgi:hypothetical protein